jgi:hypothetical protein
VRKDVECTFGILKGRFRILKNGILLQTQQQIDNVFHTCCMLHNILLTVDGLDDWESNINWNTLEPDEGIILFITIIIISFIQFIMLFKIIIGINNNEDEEKNAEVEVINDNLVVPAIAEPQLGIVI